MGLITEENSKEYRNLYLDCMLGLMHGTHKQMSAETEKKKQGKITKGISGLGSLFLFAKKTAR